MPNVKVNEVNLFYTDEGSGSETIVFSHGLLMSNKMYRAQIEHFKNHYRCIAYDHRGQGQSEVSKEGYDMDTLAEDAIGLIEKLDIGPCHIVGLSMGGFVGMRIAARRPDLLKSLVLLDTSSDEEPNVFKYNMLKTIMRLFGIGVVINRIAPIMFGHNFLNDAGRSVELSFWKNEWLNLDKSIVKAVTGVIERKGIYAELESIGCPTLVAVGDQDVATVISKSERIHKAIPGSQLQIISGAGHSSSVEEPEAVNSLLENFWRSL